MTCCRRLQFRLVDLRQFKVTHSSLGSYISVWHFKPPKRDFSVGPFEPSKKTLNKYYFNSKIKLLSYEIIFFYYLMYKSLITLSDWD